MYESTTPLVVEYLRTHSATDLMTDHGVRMSVSRERPYKASFNYDQITARDADPLAQQCRGLVLATVDGSSIAGTGTIGDTFVIARPMDRFFNLGQGAAHVVDDADPLHPDARVWSSSVAPRVRRKRSS